MSNELGSSISNSQELFESALHAYKTKTGVTLVEHPLVVKLQNCHSEESIIAFLKGQIRASIDVGANHRIIQSIENTASILCTLTAAVAPDCTVGLVRLMALMTC
jgi:hypothetical protein